jgi:hypothetical protein
MSGNLFVILFDQLLAVDQLTAVRQSGEAFSELEESTPTFPPTFKVDSCGIFCVVLYPVLRIYDN